MLVLTRRANQSIMIGHEIVVTVLEVRGDQVRLGIKAPRSIDVHREEIFAQLQQANRDAVKPPKEALESLPEHQGASDRSRRRPAIASRESGQSRSSATAERFRDRGVRDVARERVDAGRERRIGGDGRVDSVGRELDRVRQRRVGQRVGRRVRHRARDVARPRSASTPWRTNTGSLCVVSWMPSMQPPWSIAQSMITAPRLHRRDHRRR